MKSEIFPTPDRLHKAPDSPSGPFDTKEMRCLREQLEEAEQVTEDESEAENDQGEVKTEYEAINAAWDDVDTGEKTEMLAEPYTPEEALALVEELDRIHGTNAEETDSGVEPAAEAGTPDLISAEGVEPVFEEMSVRDTVGNALADIEIAFGNSSHEIVQTARVMASQILDHLQTVENIESQSEWRQSLQGKVANLLQLRSDFVGPDGQKMNAEDPTDAMMPNVFQLQPELASKRRAEILAESGVAQVDSAPELKNDFNIKDLGSLESDFSDASVSIEVPEPSVSTEELNLPNEDGGAGSVYTEHHKAMVAARGAALMKNYTPSNVPLGYDPNAPRAKVKTPPKKKGFFAKLFGL